MDGRVALVAYAMNGEPLPVTHGFPALLIVAGLYGYVSATKWLSEIELTTWEDFDGYGISRGWAKEGPIKTASRIDTPRRPFRAGRQAIAGVAWAQTRGISRVEVRVDGGDWLEARLSPQVDADIWRQWLLPYDFAPGAHAMPSSMARPVRCGRRTAIRGQCSTSRSSTAGSSPSSCSPILSTSISWRSPSSTVE